MTFRFSQKSERHAVICKHVLKIFKGAYGTVSLRICLRRCKARLLSRKAVRRWRRGFELMLAFRILCRIDKINAFPLLAVPFLVREIYPYALVQQVGAVCFKSVLRLAVRKLSRLAHCHKLSKIVAFHLHIVLVRLVLFPYGVKQAGVAVFLSLHVISDDESEVKTHRAFLCCAFLDSGYDALVIALRL